MPKASIRRPCRDNVQHGITLTAAQNGTADRWRSAVRRCFGLLRGGRRRCGRRGIHRIAQVQDDLVAPLQVLGGVGEVQRDRKSTRLNSSQPSISDAVFSSKKKKK